jgi:hypothetical protein
MTPRTVAWDENKVVQRRQRKALFSILRLQRRLAWQWAGGYYFGHFSRETSLLVLTYPDFSSSIVRGKL